ncbi:hypothetical protein [Sporosarcina sp. HYO08]|uniref:hypothetical protein n=1 Tax=Sporosarcina sp. HYO08 TaxID=1759557 RepID=UPI0007984BC3|nr:hypothetical protein [Sporosarcina sp. HYO08]KXH87082.1 hypothetical protein AU377_00435 [Sporosarcina sp. HYO08]
MPVFFNHDGHPEVFQNASAVVGHNQMQSKIEPLEEWKHEQREKNRAVQQRLETLDTVLADQKKMQLYQLIAIRQQLQELVDHSERHDLFEHSVMDSIEKLEKNHTALQEQVTEDRLSTDQWVADVHQLKQETYSIVKHLDEIVRLNEDHVNKLNEQLTKQKQLSDEMNEQKATQHDMLQRLDAQEGLIEKIVRRLDYFRFILYERTNHLTDKIEEGYRSISSPMTNLLIDPNKTGARWAKGSRHDSEDPSN